MQQILQFPEHGFELQPALLKIATQRLVSSQQAQTNGKLSIIREESAHIVTKQYHVICAHGFVVLCLF